MLVQRIKPMYCLFNLAAFKSGNTFRFNIFQMELREILEFMIFRVIEYGALWQQT